MTDSTTQSPDDANDEYIRDWKDVSTELFVSISNAVGLELEVTEDDIRDMPRAKRVVKLPVTCFSRGDDEPVPSDANPLESIMEGTAVVELMVNKGIIEGVEMNFSSTNQPIITCIVQMPMRRSMKLEKDDYAALCQAVLTLYAVHRVRDQFRAFMKRKVFEACQPKTPPANSDTTIH